jgi:hypothetical protein
MPEVKKSATAEAVKEREGVTTDRAAEATAVAAGTVSAPPAENAVVIGAGDKVSDFNDAGAGEEMVQLTKDVYEEFYFPNTKRPSYRLLFTEGQVVSKKVVEAIGAAVDEAELDKVNPARIDSSTLASGTHPGIGAQL